MSEEDSKKQEDEMKEGDATTLEIEETGGGDASASAGGEGGEYPSSYAHKKHDMVLDPDGATMQDVEGGRAIIQVPPAKTFFSQKYAMLGLLGVAAYGFIATVITLATSGRHPKTMERTETPFKYNDGSTYGYYDPTVVDADVATATDNPDGSEATDGFTMSLEEVMIAEDSMLPPLIEHFYVDMFQVADDGTMTLTPYEGTSGEVPVFWRIPTAGSRIESVLSGCVKAVLASSAGSNDEHGDEDNLRVYNFGNRAYVNVDLSQVGGIQRASELGLAESGLADVFVSPHLHYTASQLLSFPEHKGRLFTVLRHPIERAIARHSFFIRQNQPDKPNAREDLAQMTLAEYAKSEYSSKNWLTRFLVNKRSGLITEKDVQMAKEILRTKFLIGLYDKIELTAERIERYFGWFKNNQIERECHANQFKAARELDKKDYMYEVSVEDSINVGSEVYDILAKNNDADMEVYWYAVGLFDEQGKLFPPPAW
uniref:Sulfotransferase domain-containing protein n=1 Tax=Helicotheca tamesis TaxID=374047 RepID=A0A7S2N583_9STRA|mmetsp:Transcript_9652/g.13500  ORF Transcript_9652/g.13500 Transcript_9652/m.13500 type:complete len:484 (+) Transcript_9652:168-1619(+)|eukprot:CAMPEP_0185729822 /NCGR_PEP_ID=MMETSP1171-20130828/7425_1 /TAXON_ID=374046 /ORGANISM="Helicotheca tamensis, Strain CCMP826" /LENGTH=483 /DNA_ID=CAMNT_0028398741 /DNA_START=113 /DNA_END=1564 /DNA_ORIENTATION=+